MSINIDLEKKLKKIFQPVTLIEDKYKGKDITFKTDDKGNPVLLFIGKRTGEGIIKGERYVRTLKKDENGNVIKDHWEKAKQHKLPDTFSSLTLPHPHVHPETPSTLSVLVIILRLPAICTFGQQIKIMPE